MNAANVQFPKLSNNNYHVWKFNMELLLLERELWDIVVNDVPDVQDSRWLARDGKARATIGLAVEESQKVLIKQLRNAKAFWDTLKKHHEKANITNKVSLLRLMSSKRLVSGQSMENHINDFLSIADRLRDLGESLEEHKIVAFLLGTLPDDYNNLISSLEMRPEADLTMDFVKEKLIQEFKRKSKCEGENEAAFKIQKKG
ncbi:Copia protein [Eumeta japonica]|uniref:Copia protein n=1 Tax=Eumeta variegata TaxID=151549 RepID=A0A4C1SZM2_EUMVA|nr:Copia protein [Eumeta japonica]